LNTYFLINFLMSFSVKLFFFFSGLGTIYFFFFYLGLEIVLDSKISFGYV